MPLIGIDASRANAGERTGTEWYSYYLIQALKKFQVPGCEYVLYSKKFLRDGLEEFPPGWNGKILAWKRQKFWNQFRLSWELWRHPVDLFFQPTHTLPIFPPKRSVTTLHDIGFERLPKLYRPNELRYHKYSAHMAVRRADRILAVSEFTRQEILDRYKLPPERVVVTHEGVDTGVYRPDLPAHEVNAVLDRYRVTRPYFIYVGRIEEKKNVVNLVRAFSIFKGWRGVGDPIRLLLVGAPGFGFERVRKEIRDRKLEEHVMIPGYVDEAHMQELYSAAVALIFPSAYEGFGLPILQAQACGTPVVTSDRASMPEVAGRGALLVNPDAPEDIAVKMRAVTEEGTTVETLKHAGFENVKRFSWDECARKTLNVFLEVLGIQHQV